MTIFEYKLTDELKKSRCNFYFDNFNKERYGHLINNHKLINYFLYPIKTLLCRFHTSTKISDKYPLKELIKIKKYMKKLSWFYSNLNDSQSKELLISIIAFRLLGYLKYKLPLSNKKYWKLKKSASKLVVFNTTPIKSHIWNLRLFDLNKMGLRIKLYCINIVSIFLLKQYEYHSQLNNVRAGGRDVVFDIGACWGDSALYFSNLVDTGGKVYAFEPNNNNLKILETNLDLNRTLKKKIIVVKQPVWSFSGKRLYLSDDGPGSKIRNQKIKNYSFKNSISVDDFVSKNKISRVDLIKMDIEGAELPVLNGAIKTIRRFKPRLAISIYHSMDDFVDIPKFIKTKFPYYKIFLGHYTIHCEETILFATINE